MEKLYQDYGTLDTSDNSYKVKSNSSKKGKGNIKTMSKFQVLIMV